jgi:hypothetical protein
LSADNRANYSPDREANAILAKDRRRGKVVILGSRWLPLPDSHQGHCPSGGARRHHMARPAKATGAQERFDARCLGAKGRAPRGGIGKGSAVGTRLAVATMHLQLTPRPARLRGVHCYDTRGEQGRGGRRGHPALVSPLTSQQGRGSLPRSDPARSGIRPSPREGGRTCAGCGLVPHGRSRPAVPANWTAPRQPA